MAASIGKTTVAGMPNLNKGTHVPWPLRNEKGSWNSLARLRLKTLSPRRGILGGGGGGGIVVAVEYEISFAGSLHK